MALPHAFLDRLREKLPISDVVGRKVKLIRAGAGEYKGLCPFHNEKTPSFTVSDPKGFYHCFGCGAHGDIIAFTMQSGNLPFMDAIETLADEAGMDVPRPDPKEREAVRKRVSLRDVVEKAAQFYEQKLKSPEGRDALAYLRRRGLSDDVIAQFRLGWAPGGNALKAFLSREGVSEADMIEAGLLRTREAAQVVGPDGQRGGSGSGGNSYDVFRERVIFPITDVGGRPIAFGGRILGQGEPKYLNSPEGPLFHKGSVLFNLARAREAARASGRLMVVEGYMDVIALANHGIGHAVAPLGTALTEIQLSASWKIAERVVLCFDGDKAGQKAARRAMERALPLMNARRRLSFCLLPDGKDPDDVVNDYGSAGIHHLLDRAEDISAFAWGVVSEGLSAAEPTPSDWADAAATAKSLSGLIADSDMRFYFAGDLERRMREMRYQKQQAARSHGTGKGKGQAESGSRRTWQGGGRRDKESLAYDFGIPNIAAPPDPDRLRRLLALVCLLNHPQLYDRIADDFGRFDFYDPDLEEFYHLLDDQIIAHPESVESEGLWSLLEGPYWGPLRQELDLRQKAGHFSMLAPENGEPQIIEVWRNLLSLIVLEDLRRECEQAVVDMGEDMSADSDLAYESVERIQALVRLQRAAREDLPDSLSA